MSNSSSSSDGASQSTDIHSADTVAERPAPSTDAESLTAELNKFPDLARNRSYVIERAVVEFKSLANHNPALSPQEYGQRFLAFDSSLQSSIVRQLEVEQFLAKHPGILAGGHEAWPLPGDTIGPFEILEELGSGGIARVYLCRQPGLGNRQVVVKLGGTALIEAHTLAQLRHPSIVPVHSAEFDPRSGMVMLCMAFLGRSTLCDLVEVVREPNGRKSHDALLLAARRRHRSSDQVFDDSPRHALSRSGDFYGIVAYLGERLAGALRHAHCQGIVHGDVKPSNILLAYDGAPLLMDFNLSGNADMDLRARGGTLPYMPPEQLRLMVGEVQSSSYDARSDIYSLGIVFYELLTGRLPFELSSHGRPPADIATELLQQQAKGCTSLSRHNARIPTSIAGIIERCLAVSPERRFQTAEALQLAFQRELKAPARWRRWAQARKRGLAIASLLTLAAAALGVGALLARPPAHIRHFDRGTKFLQTGDLAGAQRAFTQSLEAAPEFVEARFELAHTLMQQKKPQRASDEFHRLAQEEPSTRHAAYLGYSLCLQGKILAALAWLRRAESLGSSSPELHNNLAVAYELGTSEHSPDERRALVRRHLEIALRQLPQSPVVRLNWISQELNEDNVQDGEFPARTLQMATDLARELPANGTANRIAALIIAKANAPTDKLVADGGRFLAAAIRNGVGPSRQEFLESPLWRIYQPGDRSVAILAALNEGQPKAPTIVSSRFLEPISLRAAR